MPVATGVGGGGSGGKAQPAAIVTTASHASRPRIVALHRVLSEMTGSASASSGRLSCLEEARMPFAHRPAIAIAALRDHPAETIQLPGASAPVRAIVLSRAETGAISALLILPPGWKRIGSSNPATFVEYFCLSGDVEVGGRQLQPWHYLRVPAGVDPGEWSSNHGARLLVFTEGALTAASDRPSGEEPVTHVNANLLEWSAPFVFGAASSRPEPVVKVLFRHPTGGQTRLVRHPAHWNDPRLLRSRSAEEMYCLAGEWRDRLGAGSADSYFWRPPGTVSGNLHIGESGRTALVRTDAPPVPEPVSPEP
jgi:hypothetical protein